MIKTRLQLLKVRCLRSNLGASREALEPCMLSPTEKSPNKITLSALPVELWLKILHYATFVPILLGPDIYYQSRTGCHYSNHWKYNTMLYVLRNRLSLIPVCKQWKSLCITLPYQSILVKNPPCLRVLVATLTKPCNECSADDAAACSLGSFTMCLDITETFWRSNGPVALHHGLSPKPVHFRIVCNV
ncbi:hypothetical protein BS17DRAFT_384250 [Gyrodon lividus]|nr:hypothetical protein BS17DRAFT_384250 [Gyrodon lividus]